VDSYKPKESSIYRSITEDQNNTNIKIEPGLQKVKYEYDETTVTQISQGYVNINTTSNNNNKNTHSNHISNISNISNNNGNHMIILYFNNNNNNN